MLFNTYDISVIIPIYNTAGYLDECLSSVLKGAGKLRAQIILIDDGSTDGSREKAEAFVKAHKGTAEFHAVPNGGIGRARNAGAGFAKGRYMLFADSDDFVESGIYETMFRRAELTEADLTVCNAARFDKKAKPSPIHLSAFSGIRSEESVTTLAETPSLVFSGTIWNLLIRRRFWMQNGFRFPEGVFYEDMFLSLHLLHKAGRIATVRTRGYYWRIRDEVQNPSVTQRIRDLSLIRDKADEARRFMAYADGEIKDDNVRRCRENKLLVRDFIAFLSAVPFTDEETARKIAETIAACWKDTVRLCLKPDGEIGVMPLPIRQLWHDLMAGDVAHAIRVINYRKTNFPYAAVSGNSRISLPDELFTIPDRDLSGMFDYNVPTSNIFSAEREGSVLRLHGSLYAKRLDHKPGFQKINAFALNDENGGTLPLEVTEEACPQLTEEAGAVVSHDDYTVHRYDYDGAGFQLDVPLEQLSPGRWQIVLSYRSELYQGERALRGASAEAKAVLPGLTYRSGRRTVTPSFDRSMTLFLKCE